MKIQEGALCNNEPTLLEDCIPGDVVNIGGTVGNPYLVIDPQEYQLYVYRSRDYEATGEGVEVVSLCDSRLRKLNGRTDVTVIKAEVLTE